PSQTRNDYTFKWYKGNNPDEAFRIHGETSYILNNLDPGVYTAIATQDFPNYCPGNPLSITIRQISQPPSLTSSVTNNNSCDPDLYNGQIEITAKLKDPLLPPLDPSREFGEDEDDEGYNILLYAGTSVSGTEKFDVDVTTSPFSHTFIALAPGD